MDYLNFILYLLLALVAIHLLLSTVKKSKQSHTDRTLMPPGPAPIPIFGNLLSLGSRPHVSLTELAKTHGPLMTLHLGQVPTVVISSAAVAKEALQKNDALCSSRRASDAVCALNHHQDAVIWLPPGAKWRNLRKICNSHVFSSSRLETSLNLRRCKVRELVKYVQKCSESGVAVDVGQAGFNTVLNVLSSIFFSMDLGGDPSAGFGWGFKEVVRGIVDEAGRPNLADYFPVLKWVDPQGVRRRTSVHFGKMMGLFDTMIQQRLQGKRPSEMIQGNDVLDALLGINQENKPEEIDRSKIPNLLVDLFTAGTDTTSSTLEWAMTELLRNPEKLKKSQAELDEIIGRGNPVEESDISRLPYLQAVVQETLRLHPAVPLILRKVDSDVKLFDYTVPKDTQMFVNAWAIGRDPEIWENPNAFEPERFLGSEIDVKGRDFELIPFGAGRRICPGMPLAIRMIPLMLGSLIHGFDWKLEGGVSPDEIDMEERFGLALEKAQRLRAIPVRL